MLNSTTSVVAAPAEILSALRLLQDDKITWGEWFPVRASSRAEIEQAMSRLCADPDVAGFERRDIDRAEFDSLKAARKVCVTLRGVSNG